MTNTRLGGSDSLATQAREPVAHYEHREIGYNYRLSNLLTAIGIAQLGRLDAMLERRRARREAYARIVAEVPGVEVFQRRGDRHDNRSEERRVGKECRARGTLSQEKKK